MEVHRVYLGITNQLPYKNNQPGWVESLNSESTKCPWQSAPKPHKHEFQLTSTW